MLIVSRREWGAVHEPGDGPAPLPARELWLHHSVTVAPDLVPPFDDEHAAMRLLEQIGERKFGRGISYTFAVMPSGRVYEGHGVATLGAHTARRNSIARAIVLVGNYDVASPTAQQVESSAQLVDHGRRSGWWTVDRLNGGHRQAPGASTACPGRYGMAVVDAINRRAFALRTGAGALTEGLDPMITPEQLEAIVRKGVQEEVLKIVRMEGISGAAGVQAALVDLLIERIRSASLASPAGTITRADIESAVRDVFADAAAA